MTQALFGLSGKVALVTGASGGLGRHFAKVLAHAGAVVVVTARRADKLSELVAEISAAAGAAHAVEMDVTDAQSVAAAFDKAIELAGAPDVLINNAGLTVTKPLLQQTDADWGAVVDTNLKGNWLVATEAARRMVEAKRPGAIVNIASILGERVAGGVAALCDLQGGCGAGDQGHGARTRPLRHSGQRLAARLCGDRPQPRFFDQRSWRQASLAHPQPPFLRTG